MFSTRPRNSGTNNLAIVPEPGTMYVLGLALPLFALLRRQN
ncbi:MAG: PEP-CTERM sorting domain-containing protein [Verrucomicrobia bacterium]|nr:PEP-CTERM sorting domain-containing protein [Verrucomicrobiota bacterium]